MNRAIEIHDSTLDAIILRDGLAVLHFSSVYIHESGGTPGVHAGSGWVQEAYLRIESAVVVGSFSELPCDLWDGHIKLAEIVSDKMMPIPLDYKGEVELLFAGNGEVVSITGTSVKLELVGEPTYVEEFRP